MAFMSQIAPPSFVRVQSTREKFLPVETAKALFAPAKEPNRLHLMEASNRRFSDRRDDERARVLESLQRIWSRPADRPQGDARARG